MMSALAPVGDHIPPGPAMPLEAEYASRKWPLAIGSSVLAAIASCGTTPNTSHPPQESYEVASGIFEHDAAVWDNLNCSAFLIRDPVTDSPVGALTAAHCNYVNPDIITDSPPPIIEPRWRTLAGVTSVSLPAGANVVSIGLKLGQLQEVGEVQAALVATDDSSDEAVEIFAGQTPSKVLEDLKHMLASEDEVSALIPGTSKIYVAGWPVNGADDGDGHREQQQFTALYLGTGSSETLSGKMIPVIWAAFPKTQDGATCSPGLSGSGAFILHGSKPVLLGALMTGLPDHTVTEWFPNLDKSKYPVVCGIARPTLGKQPDTLLQVN